MILVSCIYCGKCFCAAAICMCICFRWCLYISKSNLSQDTLHMKFTWCFIYMMINCIINDKDRNEWFIRGLFVRSICQYLMIKKFLPDYLFFYQVFRWNHVYKDSIVLTLHSVHVFDRANIDYNKHQRYNKGIYYQESQFCLLHLCQPIVKLRWVDIYCVYHVCRHDCYACEVIIHFAGIQSYSIIKVVFSYNCRVPHKITQAS